jgi:DNA-binding NarL/FixJ family response regulator
LGGFLVLTLRVLLIDDSPAFLQAACRHLAATERLEVVGQGRTGLEALEQSARLKPDLVLLDLAMPEMNGLEAAQRIKAQPQPPKVVILTLHDDPEHRAAALAAGADACLAKARLTADLLPLIRQLGSAAP